MEEVFKKTNKNIQIKITLCLLIIFGVIGFRLFVGRIINEASEFRKEFSEVSKEDIVTLKRLIRRYEENNNVIQKLVLDKNKTFLFINDVERLAQYNGLESEVQLVELSDVLYSGELISVNKKESVGSERSHGQLKVVIDVGGEWEEIMTFLLAMENIPREAIVDSVRLSSGYDSIEQRATWTATFNILAITN